MCPVLSNRTVFCVCRLQHTLTFNQRSFVGVSFIRPHKHYDCFKLNKAAISCEPTLATLAPRVFKVVWRSAIGVCKHTQHAEFTTCSRQPSNGRHTSCIFMLRPGLSLQAQSFGSPGPEHVLRPGSCVRTGEHLELLQLE